MRIMVGDLLPIAKTTTDPVFVTTNSYIKSNNCLVMGRGFAKKIRDNFKGIDLDLGKQIKHMSTYRIQQSKKYHNIYAFQVKRGFLSDADLTLISQSTYQLRKIAIENPNVTHHINFPGIGNGRRKIEEVMPILKTLPDNVHVWVKTKREIEEVD